MPTADPLLAVCPLLPAVSDCCPSRNSFMSGRRPERTKIMNFNTDFRKSVGKDWTAMPQFFKEQGYFTTSAGKIYHDGMDEQVHKSTLALLEWSMRLFDRLLATTVPSHGRTRPIRPTGSSAGRATSF